MATARTLPPMPDTHCPAWCSDNHARLWELQVADLGQDDGPADLAGTTGGHPARKESPPRLGWGRCRVEQALRPG